MPCCKVSINKSYHCDKAGCVCIPTGGKSCICICENERGQITKCDDCKCVQSDNGHCKCDDSKCTCIDTKGADCICVCKDEGGGFKTCDCFCSEENTTKDADDKSSGCCSKKTEEKAGSSVAQCEGKSTGETMTASKNYKCDKPECVCVPTGGKSCICVCENKHGEIVTCDDCKCDTEGKCDDSKCTCIDTKGADCICVCKDEGGGFKTCECLCSEENTTKDEDKKGCCSKKTEERGGSSFSQCEGKSTGETMTASKNYKCDKPECVCIPTGGKSCICVCENKHGEIVTCDDCKCDTEGKCDDSKCTCIDTKGAECICVCKDEEGGFKVCDCSCSDSNNTGCCKEDKQEQPKSCCS